MSDDARHTAVRFLVTGFGKFGGVSENPTSVTVRALQDFTSEGCEIDDGDGLTVLAAEVIEVSTIAADEAIARLVAIGERANSSAATGVTRGPYRRPRSHTVLVHLGVAVGSPSFDLESRATNNATFRIPDERGWQPRGERIIADEPHEPKLTDIAVHVVARRLAASGHAVNVPVAVSYDAGAFLCNWIYFKSLAATEHLNSGGGDDVWHSLFVHVPAADVADAETQLRFARAMLREVARSIRCGERDDVSPSPLMPAHPHGQLIHDGNADGKDGVVADRTDNGRGDASEPPTTTSALPAATPLALEHTPVLQRLLDLGFPADLSATAARDCNTVEAAIEWVLAALEPPRGPIVQSLSPRCKLAVAVRLDLNMSPGKIAAQVAHGALAAARAASPTTLADWRADGEPIVVLRCRDAAHMQLLQDTARAVGVYSRVIRDAGMTQVEPGSATVLAVGPASMHLVDAVTGALKLL